MNEITEGNIIENTATCSHCDSENTTTISLDAKNWRCVNIKSARIRTLIRCNACGKHTVYRLQLKQHVRDMCEMDKEDFYKMEDKISPEFYPMDSDEDKAEYAMERAKYE